MAQGGLKNLGGKKTKKPNVKRGDRSKKRHGTTPVNAKKFVTKADKKITANINNNIERLVAGKLVQSGSKLNMRDIQTSGKEVVKEIRQEAFAKRRSKKEVMVASLKKKIAHDKEGEDS